MFKINHIRKEGNQLTGLELFNTDTALEAKINLINGASLEQLKLQGIELISDVCLNYKKHFNSAIMFPFANRVYNGKYAFNGKNYQLAVNDPTTNSSLHGLVYNQTFEVFKIHEDQDKLSVTLVFDQKQETPGFPFMFSLYVTYSFHTNYLEMQVKIVNNSEQTFPFTLGWHPYFKQSLSSKNQIKLFNGSEITFNNDFEYQMIPLNSSTLVIGNNTYDHCYLVRSDKIKFENEAYSMEMKLGNDEHFIQIYTPSNKEYVAIEPQTGPANSFNNGLGLKTLNPKEIYEQTWNIHLIETNS